MKQYWVALFHVYSRSMDWQYRPEYSTDHHWIYFNAGPAGMPTIYGAAIHRALKKLSNNAQKFKDDSQLFGWDE
jgi:hypothetical protein